MAKRIIALAMALALLCGVVGTVAAAASPSEVIGDIEQWLDKKIDGTIIDDYRDFVIDKAGLSEYVCSSKLHYLTAVNAIANGIDLTHDFGEPYKQGDTYYHTCMRETCGATYPTTVSGSSAGAAAYLTYSHYADGKFYFIINNGVTLPGDASWQTYIRKAYNNKLHCEYLVQMTFVQLTGYALNSTYSVVLTGVPAPMSGTYNLSYELTKARTETVDTYKDKIRATGFVTTVPNITSTTPSGVAERQAGYMNSSSNKRQYSTGDDLIALTASNNKLSFAPSKLTQTDANKGAMVRTTVEANIYVAVASSYAQEYEELIPQIINVSGELVVVGDNNEISYYDNANFINEGDTYEYDNSTRTYTIHNEAGDITSQITYSNEMVIKVE